jgi:hypothetical protein
LTGFTLLGGFRSLSHNKLEGTLPDFSESSLRKLLLHNNKFHGSFQVLPHYMAFNDPKYASPEYLLTLANNDLICEGQWSDGRIDYSDVGMQCHVADATVEVSRIPCATTLES